MAANGTPRPQPAPAPVTLKTATPTRRRAWMVLMVILILVVAGVFAAAGIREHRPAPMLPAFALAVAAYRYYRRETRG